MHVNQAWQYCDPMRSADIFLVEDYSFELAALLISSLLRSTERYRNIQARAPSACTR